ncbi:MAG: pyruvate kinase [Deltaproteobacteria bacterium]|nr:pyruvate kinase [Deltaproteobacteria bacterium]MBW2339271.1 pyruvate kinase [Deltaproteobacteria bacterium]
MPHTKIVCTIGPASESPEIIRAMIKGGMNVARLNFSHGNHREHKEKIGIIRSVSDELSRPVAILQDLAGPKIRVGILPEPGITIEAGQTLTLTNQDIEGTHDRVSVSYPSLPGEVEPGDRILLSDGAIELVVQGKNQFEVYCEVVTGGLLTSHKGLNLPTRTISAPAFTETDREDLLFGLENGVDFIALSFVSTAEDILRVKEVIRQRKKDIPVIAKIERHEVLDYIDEIIEAADGIMVARGDLGVEIPLEDVPVIQKMLIQKANDTGKPVITATQMLRSMENSPRPTRAEAADVANAVLDGTDAVMLSEETATGNYPVHAVQFMARIIKSAEKNFCHDSYLQLMPKKEVPDSVAHAACILASHLDASAIVAPTGSGKTAMHISRFRPQQPIIALSPNANVVRRLTLFWGCLPHLVPEPTDTDDMIERSAELVLKTGYVSKNDLVVMTAGHPVGVAGTTNMVRVKRL